MSTKRNASRAKKSKGLGDTIEKVTKATGIKAIVEKAFPDCGCKERKEWANKAFPYVNAKQSCMTQEQYDYYKGFKEQYLSESKQVSIPNDEMKKLVELYNSIYQVDVKGCNGCNAAHFVKKLDVVFMAYEEEK